MEENVLAKIFGDDEAEGAILADETDAADPPLGDAELGTSRFVVVVIPTHGSLSWERYVSKILPDAGSPFRGLV